MKKKIILFMGVVYFVSIFAVEMNLKYSSVNLSRCTEVSGLVNFYKKTIDEMQDKDGAVRARVDSLIRNLSKNEKYRILYLDWYVNHNYPEFYKEFFFINSIFTRPVESGLYSEEDIYNYSIYPRKWIEPYFTKEVTPTNVLPSLVEIREKVWKSVIEVEPEFLVVGRKAESPTELLVEVGLADNHHPGALEKVDEGRDDLFFLFWFQLFEFISSQHFQNCRQGIVNIGGNIGVVTETALVDPS